MRRALISTGLAVVMASVVLADGPPASKPAAPATSSTQPGGVPTTLPSFLSAVPAGVLPDDARHWTVAKAEAANSALSDHPNRNVRLELFIVEVAGGDQKGIDYTVTALDSSAASGINTVKLQMTRDASAYASQLNVGGSHSQTLDATVSSATVDLGGRTANDDGTYSETGTLTLTLTKAWHADR